MKFSESGVFRQRARLSKNIEIARMPIIIDSNSNTQRVKLVNLVKHF
jgi:hypothetical protein